MHTGEATDALIAKGHAVRCNLRQSWPGFTSMSLDETTTRADVELLWKIFARTGQELPTVAAFEKGIEPAIPPELRRTSAYLAHPVFNTHHSETGMLRYIRSLSDKDLALDRTMIPLGSCTMKLNATSEMIPITWPEFAHVHPFAPRDQCRLRGARRACAPAVRSHGVAGIACSPRGSQGDTRPAGHQGLAASRGESHRKVC